MVTDPVCEMQVEDDTNIKSEYNGKTYRFCSEECKEVFENDPEIYISSAA